MVTPRTCRLCSGEGEYHPRYPLCPECWVALERSGEGRRYWTISAEDPLTDQHRWRMDGAVTDYITRVIAEREVERGRS